jgi:hypothetical protein
VELRRSCLAVYAGVDAGMVIELLPGLVAGLQELVGGTKVFDQEVFALVVDWVRLVRRLLGECEECEFDDDIAEMVTCPDEEVKDVVTAALGGVDDAQLADNEPEYEEEDL